jgi:Response regulator containing a CheY-like receiver domain and an HTH DNA-binding domain
VSPVIGESESLKNTNERPAETTPAAQHDISSGSHAAPAVQWPLVERRTADRRQTDRRRNPHVDPLANNAAGCTCREQQIVGLLLQGMTNKQIAAELGIAEDTVKKHLHRAYKKLGIRRRALLIAEHIAASPPRRTGL